MSYVYPMIGGPYAGKLYTSSSRLSRTVMMHGPPAEEERMYTAREGIPTSVPEMTISIEHYEPHQLRVGSPGMDFWALVHDSIPVDQRSLMMFATVWAAATSSMKQWDDRGYESNGELVYRLLDLLRDNMDWHIETQSWYVNERRLLINAPHYMLREWERFAPPK